MLSFAKFNLASRYQRLYKSLILFTFISTLVTATSCLAVRYWLLPNIEQFHPQITALVSRAIGQTVKIGRIEADWLGWRPHIALSNLQILDAQERLALQLQRVDTEISWMTLLTHELRLASLRIQAPDLLIRRDAKGDISVAGLALTPGASDSKLSDWLLHQSQITLNNGQLTWQDDMRQAPPLRVTHAQFRLENRHQRHRFVLQFRPPNVLAQSIELRGDFKGRSFSKLNQWQGELFAQINQANITALSPWIQLPDALTHAQGSVRGWLQVNNGKFNQITADLALIELKSQLAAALPSLNLPSVNGRVSWQASANGWQLKSQKLTFRLPDSAQLAPTEAAFQLDSNLAHQPISAYLNVKTLDLTRLSQLAPALPLPEEMRQSWTNYNPRGQLSELSAKWQSSDKNKPQLEFKGRFEGLAINRVGDFPGVAQLSGEASGTERSGELSLNSPQIEIDASQWLLAPVHFDRFVGKASWQHLAEGWLIKVPQLDLANQDAEGSASGSFQTQAMGLGLADISLKLKRASVKKIVHYLPKVQMGQETMKWLRNGLLDGEMTEGHLRLQGNLNDFPFVGNKTGLFRVSAKARDVVIDYEKGWPRVEHANAILSIQGERLEITSNFAQLDQARVQKVFVIIPDLMKAAPLVQIRGEATGETAHGLSFIKHSPIRGYLEGFTDPIQAKGWGTLLLKLDIPISNQPLKVLGQYHFADNEIQLGYGIPMTHHVNGHLHFTESSLSANNVTLETLGGPAKLAIQTTTDGQLKINAQGVFNPANWHREINSPWLPYLEGTTPWTADITSKGTQLGVVVNSNLQGLAINLPTPLSKPINQPLAVRFELHTAGTSKDVMWLKAGDLLSARVLRNDDANGVRQFKRGYVNFGSPRQIVDRTGFWVTGNLPLLSLEGWSKLPFTTTSNSEFSLPGIDGVDINIQKLLGFGNTLTDLNLRARNQNSGLNIQVASKAITGEINWFPQGNGKLVARFKHATLGEVSQKTETSASPQITLTQRLINATLPTLDLAVENFVYKGKSLGRIELNAHRVGTDILLNNFKIANADGIVIGHGKWSLAPAQMHVVLKLEINDAGKLLLRAGYPDSMRNGQGSLDGDWVWSGGPDEFALAKVEGHFNVQMSQGQFLQLDPGAGKLLSVLSLQALPKRITLDFADVFSSGFQFDRLNGSAQIRQGMLMTQDFNLESSAAQVSMAGQVDLNRETQSLRVKVLPTVGNSVSLLAFAAGPMVGAGVFLANKILSNPLDQLAAFEYAISGSWADPKVEKIEQRRKPQ
jgi:uncharacterized protein (TIGR02099 family)